MKKRLSVFLLFFFPLLIPAQFQMRYGSPYHDESNKVIQVQDGNFIVAGYSNGFGSGGNALIMKVNAQGNLLWVKDYSGINFDVIYDIIELPGSNLVMCGATGSYGAGNWDCFLMKTDSIGTMIWARAYGDIQGEYFTKVREDGTGGFYLAGAATNVPLSLSGGVVARADNAGNLLWTRWTTNFAGTIDMQPLAGGGVVIGQTMGINDNLSVWSFSSAGNLNWAHNYYPTPTGSGVYGLSIIEALNGDLLVNYSIANQNTVAQSYDNIIMRLNSSGNLVSDHSYGGIYTDYATQIIPVNDGGFMLCGSTNSAGNGSIDASLIKIQPNGLVQWAQTYGTVWDEIPTSVIQTADNGYLFTGATWSVGFSYDSAKFHLVKTDSLGAGACNTIAWFPVMNTQTVTVNSQVNAISFSFAQEHQVNWSLNNRALYAKQVCLPLGMDENPVADQWVIFPNPVASTATIAGTANGPALFILYDLYGKQVKTISLENGTGSLSNEGLAGGMYLYEIRSAGNGLQRGKILLD